MTRNILPYSKYKYVTNMNFVFELGMSDKARLNRYNVLQNYNTKYDSKNNYLSALLNLIVSWAYASGNHLISRLNGQQLEQLGNDNAQRYQILSNGIQNLENMNILLNFKVING